MAGEHQKAAEREADEGKQLGKSLAERDRKKAGVQRVADKEEAADNRGRE